MSYPKDMEDVQDEYARWAFETFPDATPKSITLHMLKEVCELFDAVDGGCPVEEISAEIADMQLLLFHLASRLNINVESATRDKFNVNKSRVWGKPDVNGVVEHVREGAA